MIQKLATNGSKSDLRHRSVGKSTSTHTILTASVSRCTYGSPSLAFSPGILLVKAYVEMYAGKLQKQKISYKTFPQTTHTVLVLIILSSIAFNVALWPAFGSGAMVVMSLVGIFILNFCMLMPTYVQNLVAFVLLAFFLQEYS